MTLRILILGSKGMAGHIAAEFLKEKTDWEILPLDRSNFLVDDTGTWKDKINSINSEKKLDYILNFIGILKPVAVKNQILAIKINSLFPHELAKLCTPLNIKVIHISTDCWEDLDIYGRSKRAGELDQPEHLTIRTSIIGPELKSDGSGLFHWFMSQEGETNGFTKHYWDGVTTLELTKNILSILRDDPESNYILNLRVRDKVSKFELVSYIKESFNKEIIINQKETDKVDKTLENPEITSEITLKEQIEEMKEWMLKHRTQYTQYFE